MPNFMQETRKIDSAVLAVEPEPTDARIHGSEFIGSFRKLKLPGNQKYVFLAKLDEVTTTPNSSGCGLPKGVLDRKIPQITKKYNFLVQSLKKSHPIQVSLVNQHINRGQDQIILKKK